MPKKSLWSANILSDKIVENENIFVGENETITYAGNIITDTIKIDMVGMEKFVVDALDPGKVEKGPPVTPQDIVNHYRNQMETLVFYQRRGGPEGYSESNQGPGPIQFQNTQTLLAKFFINCYIDYRMRNWRDFCIGITNYTTGRRDGRTKYMPMFDYDGKNIKKQIRADVKKLQEDFKLGDAWVYRTKRGFHVHFFTDEVEMSEYVNMLEHVDCCKGFKRSTLRSGFATLRVSAKYTKFDIELEYILKAAKPERVKRILQKGHVVQELLRLGQECGTHFASLFPQWAHYHEDSTEWRTGSASGKVKSRAGRLRTKKVYRPSPYPSEVGAQQMNELQIHDQQMDEQLVRAGKRMKELKYEELKKKYGDINSQKYYYNPKKVKEK